MTGAALGVRFDGDRVVGLHPVGREPLLTQVRVVPSAVIDEAWTADGTSVLLERQNTDGSSFLRVERGPAGFRLHAPAYGLHLVAPTGDELLVTPDAQSWTGRRMLAGLTLPLVALMRGREVLHAGAVVVDGGAVAVMAQSGTGKSSTLANLMALGADFFADDVLAIEVRDGAPIAHPGPRLINLSTEVAATLPEWLVSRWSRLAQEVEVHYEPQGPTEPLPLRALVHLTRDEANADTRVERMVADAPRLLGNCVLGYIQTPERLVRQLDVVQVISRGVPFVHVHVGRTDGPAEVAALVMRQVGELDRP